jgi:hypothetical protein
VLQACIAPEETEAWLRWRAQARDPVAALAAETSLRTLLPLLLAAATAAGESDAALLTYLRAAVVRERVRFELCQAIAAEASGALAAAGIDHLVCGDLGVAAAYEEPALRHCHALALLVDVPARRETAATLERCGLRPAGRNALRHSSGLPVLLRTSLTARPFAAVRRGEAAAEPGPLAPSWRLVETLTHAMSAPAWTGPAWACDLARLSAQVGDWPALATLLGQCRLGLVGGTLLLAAAELGAPLPPAERPALASLARRAGPRERGRALAALVVGRLHVFR